MEELDAEICYYINCGKIKQCLSAGKELLKLYDVLGNSQLFSVDSRTNYDMFSNKKYFDDAVKYITLTRTNVFSNNGFNKAGFVADPKSHRSYGVNDER